MVFAIMRLFPSAKERPNLLEILRSVRDMTLVRPGCLGSWLYEHELHQHQVCYGEQWATEEDLYVHIRSELYRRILAAIELSRRQPEVQFHYVTQTRGMELIEAVRERSDSDAVLEEGL